MARKKRSGLPPSVTSFRDRHGKVRYRFRRGTTYRYFRSKPGTEDFAAELAGFEGGMETARAEIGADRTRPGSVSALIAFYYASPEFRSLATSTQSTYRGILERFRSEHGEKRVAKIERRHISTIIGAMSDRPAAANNLLALLKQLMRLAMDIGMRRDDPTVRLRGFRIKSSGFHTWSESEIAQFETRHPIGSRARLAMALLLYTGQRRSDVVSMGRQHVAGGRISVTQSKTAARLSLPIHGALREILDATPADNLTFLTTSFGKPFTAAGFGNWFRDRCNEAGLSHCSAHGLRKAAARRLAEAGASNQEIKAVTGHRTDREVTRYTQAADQRRLADQAMDALTGADRER